LKNRNARQAIHVSVAVFILTRETRLIRAFKTSNLLLAINQDPDMLDTTLTAPTLQEIRAAGNLLVPYIIRTPLLRLNLPDRPDEIYLKLADLQPIGVFKIRCMGNAMLTRKSWRKYFSSNSECSCAVVVETINHAVTHDEVDTQV
jgi:hypothetical protein